MNQLVIGVDGGGSKTVAWLSTAATADVPLGCGKAGPSNRRAVGWDTALENLDLAIERAFADAGISPETVAAACVALAGGDHEESQTRLHHWALLRRLTHVFVPSHDGMALLAAGTADAVGIALVSGTGSFAFGQNAAGQSARTGGWGYLFGDEGSGYAIGIAGLRAVAWANDGRGRSTQIRDLLFDTLDVADMPGLVEAVYSPGLSRAAIAQLSRPVLMAADDGDELACQIVDASAADLALMVATLAKSLGFEQDQFTLACGGGVFVESGRMRERLVTQLKTRRCEPAKLSITAEPVAGAVRIARQALA